MATPESKNMRTNSEKETLFGNRNFLLHWASVGIFQTGNFFTAIALPWLMLSISGDDPVMVATIFATFSLPHAIFILIGGAITDRISPLKALFICRGLFVVIMFAFSALIYLGLTPLWLIYIFAFLLGSLGAIDIPASQSLLPSLIQTSQLSKGNGVVIGTVQVARAFGPMLAGWLIWAIRQTMGTSGEPNHASLAFAFGLDAVCAASTLLIMSFIIAPRYQTKKPEKIWTLLKEGIRFCWNDHGIRLVLSYLILISFFLHGPLLTALPLYTKLQLGLSEAAYGSLFAMTGLGAIIGGGLAVVFSPSDRRLGEVVLTCDFVSGLCLFLVGQFADVWLAALFLFITGICTGIIMVAGTTWFQKRTPEIYMGRVMSILMFAVLGLIPISAALTGISIENLSIVETICIASGIIMFFSGVGFLIPSVRQMGDLDQARAEQKRTDVHVEQT